MTKLLILIILSISLSNISEVLAAASPTPSPIPRLQNIFSANPLPTAPSAGSPGFANLGAIVSSFFIIALNIAVTLSLFWLVWGVYQYIIAGGDKEGLQNARLRITWALVGLLFLAGAYLIAQYGAEIVQPRGSILF